MGHTLKGGQASDQDSSRPGRHRQQRRTHHRQCTRNQRGKSDTGSHRHHRHQPSPIPTTDSYRLTVRYQRVIMPSCRVRNRRLPEWQPARAQASTGEGGDGSRGEVGGHDVEVVKDHPGDLVGGERVG